MRTVVLGFLAGACGLFSLLGAMNARGINVAVLIWLLLAAGCAAPLTITPEGQRLEDYLMTCWRSTRRPHRLVKYGRTSADDFHFAVPTPEPVVAPRPVPAATSQSRVDDDLPFRLLRPLALGVVLVGIPVCLFCSNQSLADHLLKSLFAIHISLESLL